MNEPVIKVEGLYKKFCRNLKRSMMYSTWDVSRSMLSIPYRTDTLRRDEFWALQDINFELRKGESLGIIGINGSGKSTLLRLLTGIFPPDQGQISIKGNVGALIAVGAGFHPHMTGRENIYLNGTILGMSKQELKSKFDEIVEFADVGEFIDAPVSTYSSGMKVRLGFSVAVNVEPDILLVDEILSVGDLSFRNKSLRRMREYREKANALIFISHNLEQVRVLCDRVIILEKGKLVYDGNTHQAIATYEELTRETRMKSIKQQNARNNLLVKDQISSGEEIAITDIGLMDQQGEKTEDIAMNQPLVFYCQFTTHTFIKSLYFSFGVLNEELKSCIWLMSNDNDKATFENLDPGTYQLSIQIDEHHLVPNVYVPNLAIRNGDTGETYERLLANSSFRVKTDGDTLERGIVQVKESWKLERVKQEVRI